MYDEARVTSVHLQGIGTFPSPSEVAPSRPPKKQTVFLLCASLDLESLVYKPKYPDSVFHITIYDGPVSDFADQVAAVLREFDWDLEAVLPKQTRLTRIATGSDAQRAASDPVHLSNQAAKLFQRLVGKPATVESLISLSEVERLELLRRVAERLHRKLGAPHVTEADEDPVDESLDEAPQDEREQLPLFGVEEFDPSGSMHLPPPTRWARERAREESLFLTPPEIAREMLTEALREHDEDRPVDFGDPALGNGIFFATLMKILEPARLGSAIGVEIDPRRAATVRRKWGGPLQVRRGDFIDHHPDELRSLVVANPPYLRFQKLDRDRTAHWAQMLGRELNLSINGRSDLFVYFVLSAHSWMQPNAVACWLLPTEFMENQYGAVLREYLTTKVELLRIHVYDRAAPQFDNAKVTSAIVLFRNRPPLPHNEVTLSTGASMVATTGTVARSVIELRDQSRWSVGSLVHPKPHRIHSGTQTSIGDLFRVRRGIATGANALFVIPTELVHALDIPREWRKPVVPRARTLDSNVIETDADGTPLGITFRWLIDLDANWPEIEATAPQFAQYLREVEAEVGERTLVRTRKPPFYRQEQIPPPPFLFSYMAPGAARGGRSRFFMNKSKAVILNNYLGLYPVGRLADGLDAGVVTHDRVMDALLEVEDVDLVEGGRTYSTGLVKVEPSELATMSVWSSSPALMKLISAVS